MHIWVLLLLFFGLIQAIAIPEYNQYESLDEIFETAFNEEQLDVIDQIVEVFDDNELQTRAINFDLNSIIELINKTGLLWDGLDYAVEHPKLVERLANLTTKIHLGGNSSAITSLVGGLASEVNVSRLGNIILDSGLVQSVLDGVLLDENTRQHVSKIIYNVVENNMGLINLIFNQVLSSDKKRDLEERDLEKRLSLTKLLGNIVGRVFGSGGFYGIVNSTVVALNDTGFVVYTVQRFINTEAYVNLTGSLIKDILSANDVNLASILSLVDNININATALVEAALSDTSAITGALGKVLSGNTALKALAKRYTPGIKAIIKDLETLGLFTDLNNELFPSKSSSNKAAIETEAKATVETQDSGSSRMLISGLLIVPLLSLIML